MSPSEYDSLKKLVEEDKEATERECQEMLYLAQSLLFPLYVVSFESVTLENRSFYGSSDFIIVANLIDDTGTAKRKLSIWELKSPQSIIMESDDNKNRYRPTKALVKAENQLAHYQYEALYDGTFHRRYDVKPEDIVPGGIVMGRADRWCSKGGDQVKAKTSQDIRIAAYYKPAGFRFLTWSTILDVYDTNKPPVIQKA